jgi:hypothetical protein
MRGDRRRQESVFRFMSPEARVARRHPLHLIHLCSLLARTLAISRVWLDWSLD